MSAMSASYGEATIFSSRQRTTSFTIGTMQRAMMSSGANSLRSATTPFTSS